MNYRGEEIYHYVCPFRRKINRGATNRSAAIIAFGFVFIHPFLDGNGRIHRFLIHDMLTRDGIAEQGLVILYLHQNKGIFPHRRKKQFEEITEEEFASMVKIY